MRLQLLTKCATEHTEDTENTENTEKCFENALCVLCVLRGSPHFVRSSKDRKERIGGGWGRARFGFRTSRSGSVAICGMVASVATHVVVWNVVMRGADGKHG